MLNSFTIMGRITENVELKTTPNGKTVTSFSIAVPRDYDRNTTDFFNVVAWGNTAIFIEKYFSKGQSILIQGSLQLRKWKTEKGENRQVVELLAEKVHFSGEKKEQTAPLSEAEDLPF